MARIRVQRPYRTYRFIDKDYIVDAVRSVVQAEKLNYHKVQAISGVSANTLAGWFDGPVRKPQNATVTAVTSALGYVRRDRLEKDGTVAVAFEKVRPLNWRNEIEKQADWMLKHGHKPRKKPNDRQRGRGSVREDRARGQAQDRQHV